MSTLSERIQQGLEYSGKTQTELAAACGIKPPSVNDWISGKTKTLKAQTAHRAAMFLGVGFLWLTEGRGPMKGDQQAQLVEPGENRLPVRRVQFKLSAGISGYSIEYENGESEPIFMAKRWFDQNHYRPEKLLAVRVTGRSMEPSLFDGDLVIINIEDVHMKDGMVYAANYDGELVIKRLKRDAGQWFLASDNPDKARFSDKICEEGCGLIGRVVYKQSEHI